MHGTQTLETQRLLLRRFVPSDAQAMYETWASDAAVTRFLRWQPHAHVEETRTLLTQWAAQYECGNFYNWAVVRKADNTLMGSIGAVPSEEDSAVLEPGYAFGRNFWGQGYATEALAAVVRYLFETEGHPVLSCCHAHANPASGCVMRKCGFRHTRDGIYHKYDGTAVPCRHYLFTKEEFQAHS